MNPLPEMLQAFLDDIVAHPGEPSLWLILADWLEEHEDPRAELVRLSWSLRHERDHPEFEQRQSRVQRLLASGMLPVVPRRREPGDLDFVWIPPGRMVIGSPDSELNRHPDEEHHLVTITEGFWLSSAPVSQRQWCAFGDNNPSAFSMDGTYSGDVQKLTESERGRLPVDSVTWTGACEYCEKLSARLGHTVRLPTESQWEYACRAGTTTPFHFGHVLDGKQANCDGKNPYGTKVRGIYLSHTTLPGRYSPNAFGLYDMHGNVWEWTLDRYRQRYSYPVSELEERRVLRGGGWVSDAHNARSAVRRSAEPGTNNTYYGFRIVLTA